MSLFVPSGLYALFSSPSFCRHGRGTAPALHLPVLRPPARGVLSLVFPWLLLTLCCALALPVMVQAGEKQAKATQRAVHKLKNDRGWTVCRDMVKNLDLLQQSDASFSCELKFHPSMIQFSEPDWEELKIEDHWELVYNIEREILSDNIARSRLPFEEWTVRYKQDWQSGCYEAMGIGVAESEKGKCFAFVPRLRRTQVRFSQNGPMETVLAYTLYADYEKRCLDVRKCIYLFGNDIVLYSREEHKKVGQCIKTASEKQKGIWIDYLAGGEHMVVYHSEGKDWFEKIEPILSMFIPNKLQILGVGSEHPLSLLLHNNRAYLAEGVKAGLGSSIYRISKNDFGNYASQSICEIFRPLQKDIKIIKEEKHE